MSRDQLLGGNIFTRETPAASASKLESSLQATYTVLLRIRPEWKLHYDVQRGLRLYEEMRAAGYAPNDSDFKELMNRWAEEQMVAKAQEEK